MSTHPIANTFAYIAPIVAVLLGWAILDEPAGVVTRGPNLPRSINPGINKSLNIQNAVQLCYDNKSRRKRK